MAIFSGALSRTSARPAAMKTALSAGTAGLRVQGAEPLRLMQDHLLLLPTGVPHLFSSSLDGRCRPFDRTVKEQRMTRGRRPAT